jgi:hypothetical protein
VQVQVVRGNLLYIEKKDLPSAMLNRLLRLGAFQNPEFYKAQAMRLPTCVPSMFDSSEVKVLYPT